MDGLLVIDKSSGPTSHDVVATARRVLREQRVGHTGTLDPLATGVLPLVLGRATRLARFLTAHEKAYDATIRLGISTDTGDSQGQPVGGEYTGAAPDAGTIERALDQFRGTFLQQPPAFSAKKVGGERSYKAARARSREARALSDVTVSSGVEGRVEGPLPAPVSVSVHGLEIVRLEGMVVTLSVTCSAGFYVRSLAHDLGVALGTGAHLAGLRRVRSGDLTIEGALPFAVLCAEPEGAGRAREAIVPLTGMLESMPAVRLTSEGVTRVVHGRDISRADARSWISEPAENGSAAGRGRHVRLLGPDGAFVAVAEPSETPGLLHPAVVLV